MTLITNSIKKNKEWKIISMRPGLRVCFLTSDEIVLLFTWNALCFYSALHLSVDADYIMISLLYLDSWLGLRHLRFFFSLSEMEIACFALDIYHPNSTITSSSLTSLPPSHMYFQQMRAFILHSHKPEPAKLDFYFFIYILAPTPQLNNASQS